MPTEAATILSIPSESPRDEVLSALEPMGDWSYEFLFTNGARTIPASDVADAIHKTRARMVFPFLDALFEGKWARMRCLDIACHQGWFSSQLALRGAGEVQAIDVREDRLCRARDIQEIGALSNLTFEVQDLFEMNPDHMGTFDLVMFLGVLYHLDNPIDALRQVRSLTKGWCAIETQVAPPAPQLECQWGANRSTRSGPAMALVPSAPNHVDGDRSMVIVPTLEALYQMLYGVGFSQLFLSIPRSEDQSQYPSYDRVIIFAS